MNTILLIVALFAAIVFIFLPQGEATNPYNERFRKVIGWIFFAAALAICLAVK